MPKRKIPEIPEEVVSKMKEIGIKVKELRQQTADGKNYKDFSSGHGLNSMTVWRIENGVDSRLSSLLNVLKELGTSPEEFFKGIK